MLIGWICFFVAVEFYGVSVALLTASENGKCDFRYLIPFYAFFREKDIAGEFKVIGIPVKKCGNAVILLAAIAFVASMITLWGSKNFAAFPEKNRVYKADNGYTRDTLRVRILPNNSKIGYKNAFRP